MASFDYPGHVNPNQVHYTYQMPQIGAPEDAALDAGAEIEAEQQHSPKLGKIVSILGAVGSLALVVGVGVWGFKLIARDVSGVPVVRAVEGPMRIQPENPGGTPADHQGLAVNTVAAQGTAAPPADRLMLAPKPVSLSDEDQPMGDLKPIQASLTVDETAPDEAIAAFRNGEIDALVAELTDGIEPLTLDETPPGQEVAAIVQPEPVAIDPADLMAEQPHVALLDEPGVQQSLRPQARPARVTPTSANPSADLNAAINASVETAAGLDVDADSLPVGTRLAQLGAYDSPEIAQAEWDRLFSRFGDYMDGKKRVIQKASSGGRTFYRLRAMGFDDLSDARHFCSVLVAERADCIPVTTR